VTYATWRSPRAVPGHARPGTSTLPAGQRPAHLEDSFAITDTLIEELEAADTYVIGAPMYNFMVSASLKAWVDRIVLPGAPSTPRPARASWSTRTSRSSPRAAAPTRRHPRAGFDFQEPWLRAALGQVGLDDIRFVTPR